MRAFVSLTANAERREARRKVRRKRQGPLDADYIAWGYGLELEKGVRQGWRLDHLRCPAPPENMTKDAKTSKEGMCFAYCSRRAS